MKVQITVENPYTLDKAIFIFEQTKDTKYNGLTMENALAEAAMKLGCKKSEVRIVERKVVEEK